MEIRVENKSWTIYNFSKNRIKRIKDYLVLIFKNIYNILNMIMYYILLVIILIILILFFCIDRSIKYEVLNVNYPSARVHDYHKDSNIFKQTEGLADFQVHSCNSNNFYFEFIPNFISEKKCDEILNYCKDKNFEKAQIGSVSGNVFENNNQIRTSENFRVILNDPLFIDIREKVSNKLNIPVENQEPPVLLHYNENGFYKQHYDDHFFNDVNDKILKKLEGCRLYTTYIYLNDVNEGGETSFNNIGVKVKPKKGAAIFWRNINDSSDIVHPCALHEAIPVKKGEKWGLTIWSRSKKCMEPNYYKKLKYDILKKLNLYTE